jgi:hypothetical protein
MGFLDTGNSSERDGDPSVSVPISGSHQLRFGEGAEDGTR